MLKSTEHEFHAQNKVKMATVIVISTVISIKKTKFEPWHMIYNNVPF